MCDWPGAMAKWKFAYGQPLINGVIKDRPDDFQVVEQMPIKPSGAGEHVWLKLRKTQLSTEYLAKQLARLAGVTQRAVSYSGRKDFQAITEQWFSVWMPGQQEPDWRLLENEKITLLEAHRHDRKLRIGTHTHNKFNIRVRRVKGDLEAFAARCESISNQGVPNYFGVQRFGRQCQNLVQVTAMFNGKRKRRDKNQRGILLSSARSWLFNECLSARVDQQSWDQLHAGEPAILAGSESHFNAQRSSSECGDLSARLEAADIHPSAPLVGVWGEKDVAKFIDLHNQERAVFTRYPVLFDGLVSARLQYGRRATRCLPADLSVNFEDDSVTLEFTLNKGQFATSVMRELVQQSV